MEITGEDTHDRIKQSNLSEMVLYRIQRLILNREFKPGTILPSEKELADRFGVGKSSVREAMKMLQILGVVESRQGVGTYVCQTMNSNIMLPMLMQLIMQQSAPDALLEFREMYESAYTSLAMSKATEEDVRKLERNLCVFQFKHANHSLTVDDDVAFHRIILESTKNVFVIMIGNTVFEFLRPLIDYSVTHFADETLNNHRCIYAAFRDRDTAAMGNAMQSMFDNFYRSLSEIDPKETFYSE